MDAYLHIDTDCETRIYDDLDCFAVIRGADEQAELDALLSEYGMGEEAD